MDRRALTRSPVHLGALARPLFSTSRAVSTIALPCDGPRSMVPINSATPATPANNDEEAHNETATVRTRRLSGADVCTPAQCPGGRAASDWTPAWDHLRPAARGHSRRHYHRHQSCDEHHPDH